MAKVKISNLSKRYGSLDVINNVSLDIDDGTFVVFVGPSGCGKSTLLRMIAGLEEENAGEIYIGDRKINDVAPAKRGVSMVFQSYALYPHMTVYKNMAFGLKQAKMPIVEIDQRVRRAADVLEITPYLERMPKMLSGGQRQRVAIGRAIVREPEVFLFDEPLSNLDAALRVQTRLEFARLHEQLKTTMIYVTHDQVEAMTLADKIVVLRDGHIEQVGSPSELYLRPQTVFVAGFIGSPKMNIISATQAQKEGSDLCGIRPEHISISESDGDIRGSIVHHEMLGSESLFYITTEQYGQLIVSQASVKPKPTKAEVFLTPLPDRIHYFKNDQRMSG